MAAGQPLDFTLTEADRDGERVISLGGDLDVEAAGQLAQVLRDNLAAGRELLIDLTDVVFMDSSGLAAILKTPSPDQRSQVALAPSQHPQPRRLLEMTGVHTVFRVL